MHKIYDLLDNAEKVWRKTARTLFPLFEDTPVVKGKPDPKNERHWSFSTDGNTTHMDIFLPDKVQSYFENVVCDLYENAYKKDTSSVQNGKNTQSTQTTQKNASKKEQAERLMHDTLTYLYFHEMLHPAETPDSKTDEEKFDKALYDGIKVAESNILDADLLRKVANVRNAGWDIVIDNSFFHGTNFNNSIERKIEKVLLETPNKPLQDICNLPDGVVPIFDIVEFENAKETAKKEKKTKTFDSLFYPITRLMYGLLFTKDAQLRKKIVPQFKDAILPQIKENELEQVVTSALKGFVSELDQSQLRLSRLEKNEKEKFEQAVDILYKKYDNPKIDEAHKRVIDTAKKVLSDKRTRYDAIRGFIKPLAKYISLQKQENRPGTHGDGKGSGNGSSSGQSGNSNGSGNQSSSENQEGNNEGNKPQNNEGNNSQNITEALLNIAGQLPGQEGNTFLSNIANNPGGKLGGASTGNSQLQILATDEYYKRNAKEINIKSPRKEAVKLDLGKKRVWEKIETHYLQPENLFNIPIDKILRFQGETGITQLFQLSEFEWQYDIYEEKETEEFDYTFQNVGLELPENIVFHVDSSGSMGTANYVGTKCHYDKLMHIIYGILKPVKTASIEMKKDVQIITANFSNGTVVSTHAAEVKAFYNETINETKKVLLGFQGGGTDYTINAFSKIEKMLKPGKTVHVFVTDGDLYSSCQDLVYNTIEKLTKNSNTSFLYFNLTGSSSFGNRLEQLAKQRRNVQYKPLATLEAIQSSTLEVVMQYDD